MTNPLSQLPADPEWLRKVTEVTEHAANVLGCAVALVAIQEGGKCAVETAGVPESGPVAGVFADMPRFFVTVANVTYINDQIEAAQARN